MQVLLRNEFQTVPWELVNVERQVNFLINKNSVHGVGCSLLCDLLNNYCLCVQHVNLKLCECS